MRKINIWLYIIVLFSMLITFSGCSNNDGDYLDSVGNEYKAGLSVDFDVFSELNINPYYYEYNCDEYSEIATMISKVYEELNKSGYCDMDPDIKKEWEDKGYELFNDMEQEEQLLNSNDISKLGYEFERIGNVIAVKNSITGELSSSYYRVLLSYDDDFMNILYSNGLGVIADQIVEIDSEVLNQAASGNINYDQYVFDYYGQMFFYGPSGLSIISEYGDESFEPEYVLKDLNYLYSYYGNDVWSIADQEYGDVMDMMRLSNSVQWESGTYDKNLIIYGKDNSIYELVINGSVRDADAPLLNSGETNTIKNLLIGMGNSEAEADNFINNRLSKVEAGSGNIGELEYVMTIQSQTFNSTSFDLKIYITE